MASKPVEDLKKVRAALVEMRRKQAAKIVHEGGELAVYAPGIFNTTNWIDAIDRAIKDEEKITPAVAAAGAQRVPHTAAQRRAVR